MSDIDECLSIPPDPFESIRIVAPSNAPPPPPKPTTPRPDAPQPGDPPPDPYRRQKKLAYVNNVHARCKRARKAKR